MFLKIKYQNNLKKIKFVEEYRDYDILHSSLGAMFNIAKDQLRINFFDLEDESILIEDNHDIEYFIEQFKEEKFATLILSQIKEIANPKTNGKNQNIDLVDNQKLQLDLIKIQKVPQNTNENDSQFVNIS